MACIYINIYRGEKKKKSYFELQVILQVGFMYPKSRVFDGVFSMYNNEQNGSHLPIKADRWLAFPPREGGKKNII